MVQPWIAPEVFVVLCLGLGVALLALLGLAIEATSWRRWGPFVYLPVALGFTLLAWQAAAHGQPKTIWMGTVGLAAICVLLRILGSPAIRGACWTITRLATRPQSCCLILLFAGPAFASWYSQNSMAPQDTVDAAPRPILVDPADSEDFSAGKARTDRRRRVAVLTAAEGHASAPAVAAEAEVMQSQTYSDGMIRTAPADDSYNCHGWVFTGGQSWLKGDEVAKVIDDNGYRPVAQPRVGDLAIYRDDAGAIAHSGIVRMVENSGLILIESKWGRLGRYIHPPSVNSYPEACTYYRSPRSGHLLRGVSPQAAPAKPKRPAAYL